MYIYTLYTPLESEDSTARARRRHELPLPQAKPLDLAAEASNVLDVKIGRIRCIK